MGNPYSTLKHKASQIARLTTLWVLQFFFKHNECKTVEATLSLLSKNKIPFNEQIGLKVIRQLEQYTGNQYDLLPNGYIAKSYICLKFVQLPDF